MDFNHIAFVIHGISSELPYPAGSYKAGTTPKKNVTVKIADGGGATPYKETFKTMFFVPNSIMAGKQLNGTIEIENIGMVKADTVHVTVDSTMLPIHVVQDQTDLPPYGNITIPIAVSVPYILQGGTATITVSVNGETFNSQISIQPMYWLFIIGGVIGVCLISILWILLQKK
jgi:uncharacterized membrane protein